MSPDPTLYHVDLTVLSKILNKHTIAYGRSSESYLGDMVTPTGFRKVVIKVLRTPACGRYDVGQATKQFRREVTIVEHLNHPNIAKYLGITYYLSQQPSIVSAWYLHGDAPAFLKGRLLDERLHVIKGVIKGLCYLHSRNPSIAHGDIRGVNILVNESFEGVIGDFALSRVVEDNVKGLTDPADNVDMNGCIRWMARELIHDDPEAPSPSGPTLASDIWALGCTLCELLVEEVPYSSRKHFSWVIQDIVNGVFPFQEDAVRARTTEMWAVLRGCWGQVPMDRPSILEIKARFGLLYG